MSVPSTSHSRRRKSRPAGGANGLSARAHWPRRFSWPPFVQWLMPPSAPVERFELAARGRSDEANLEANVTLPRELNPKSDETLIDAR